MREASNFAPLVEGCFTQEKEPIAAQRNALKTEMERLTKLRARQNVEVEEQRNWMLLAYGLSKGEWTLWAFDLYLLILYRL